MMPANGISRRATSTDAPPRRVAIFFCAKGGGVQANAVLVANALAGRGWRVDLVLPLAMGPYLRSVEKGVEVVDLRARSRTGVIWRLAAYLRRASPECLIASQHQSGIYAMPAKLLARCAAPAVLVLHTPLSKVLAEESALRMRLADLAIRQTYPRYDAFVGVSSGVLADLERYLPSAAANRTRVIPNPIPIESVQRAAEEPPGESWLEAKDRPVYVAVARLSPEKGLSTLLDSFAQLRERRHARLVVVGEGPERSALEIQAHRLGIAEDVRFLGWRDNPYPLMSRADAVVVSSRREGFCRVLVEALALGAPVISTDCPCGPGEILDGGRLGVLVPVDDAAALARAMEDVTGPSARVESPATVAELSAYDVEEVTSAFHALIEEAIRARAAPRAALR